MNSTVSREIVVSESDKIAVILENGEVSEFFLSEGEQFVGDIILATVESIVPAIEAAFLDIGREKSGFIHVSDLPASRKQQSGIRQFLKPQQPLLVQVTREPTGNKGACLTGFIQLPGRFLVLTPFERRIGLSKRIHDARERARLARIARIICGSGYGLILRPEAVGQTEQALRDDLKLLLARWKRILVSSEKQSPGTTLYRDQDILERILREGATQSVSRIVVDDQATYDRAMKYFGNWSDTRASAKLRVYNGNLPIMSYFRVSEQLEKAIQPMVQLPSGGTLVIQQTEALTTIDVNTSSMTSADSQPETILRTNCEAAEEAAKQLVLRDIGGVVVIDFIDMDNPRDQQIVWQKLANALQHDKSQPQISYFSEFGLVEMTRRRQRQRLSEMLTTPCPTCQGVGRIRNLLYRADILTGEGMKSRLPIVTPEEKSSRYQSGVEKAKPSRERKRERPIPQKQVSEPPPAPPPPVKKEKVEVEDPRDLLFDASIFDAEISDEILEAYIEREDNLNVSSKLASSLDKLIAQIESEGIRSILPAKTEDTEPTQTRAAEEEETLSELVSDGEDLDSVESLSYISAEDDSTDADDFSDDDEEDLGALSVDSDDSDDSDDIDDVADLDDTEFDESDEDDVLAVAPVAKKVKKVVAKKTPPRKKVAKAKVELVDNEPLVDEFDDQDEVSFASDVAISEQETKAGALTSAALVDGSRKTTKRTKPVKKLLTRRRTIRSFKPKK